MKLTQEQEEEVVRGRMAADFLDSDFFKTYLLPHMDKERMKGYPDPKKKGWEDEYRMARAVDEVYTGLISTLMLWKQHSYDLSKSRKETETDITLA